MYLPQVLYLTATSCSARLAWHAWVIGSENRRLYLPSLTRRSVNTALNLQPSTQPHIMLVSLTVGKVDAGVAVLLTEDKRLVSFPSTSSTTTFTTTSSFSSAPVPSQRTPLSRLSPRRAVPDPLPRV